MLFSLTSCHRWPISSACCVCEFLLANCQYYYIQVLAPSAVSTIHSNSSHYINIEVFSAADGVIIS